MAEQNHAADAAPGVAPPASKMIVAIGASAGGVKTLQRFFQAMPGNTGAVFVVIAHLDPESRSQLPQILASSSQMPVVQVTGTAQLKENCIYVIPPDRQLEISDSHIAAVPFEEPRGRRMPIDTFFRSLAEQHGDGFAAILTGAGSDGALGIRAVKERGGIILVQDPEEAEYASMPRAAIATGIVDLVLPVTAMAERLPGLVRAKRQNAAERGGDEDDGLRRILTHLRVRTGHDFSNYKRSTVLRRIGRRMQLAHKESFEDYFAYLRETPDEAQGLLADLLISVTTFFRDSAAFGSLAKNAIPHLFANAGPAGLIRVWVPGCATGEEAYSIAMLLLEEAARQEMRPALQLFGTDMDARALAVAREGCYPEGIEADVGERRLSRFFQRDGNDYRVKRELRDLVLFANHSLLKDPPFSRIDLIACRNLLIYLNRDLQQQVLATFNYALNRDGYLFLGASESAEHAGRLFRTVDRESRLYQTTGRSDKPPFMPRLLGPPPPMARIPDVAAPAPGRAQAQHREMLETGSPPSMVVDSSYRILHLSENAGRYLLLPGGVFTADVTELAREEIRFDLRRALHGAFERNETTLSPALAVEFNGEVHRLIFQVKPAPPDGEHNEPRALIFFIEGRSSSAAAQPERPRDEGAAPADTIRQLQQELEMAQSRLRTLREESEAANEELRATNEELQSINEEYRSTAEELETSKEELQSINEELETVNTELKLKLDIVSRANSDMNNLMAATDLSTLFLDSALRIKRFTPRTTEIFNITQNDVGRPVTDFTHQLAYGNFAADVQKVLKDLVPLEREVTSRDENWYLVRLRPYRTVEDKIDGAVVTFVNITQAKLLEARLRLLLGELTHRVKNILAVVQGMVHQTWRTSESGDAFIKRLNGRLAALAASHNLLVDSEWIGADLHKLVRSELNAYASEEKRLRIHGESVALPADLATPFGLVLHELATNAIKYGALSNDDGHVNLNWTVEPGNKGPLLKFSWQEHGGPRVSTPSRYGFGSTLIQKGLPGAKVKHNFLPEGVECVIELPIPEGVRNGPAGKTNLESV